MSENTAEDEKERLELKLREALESATIARSEWQNTFDNITDLISFHDRDFNITKVNMAFTEYFGGPECIINRKCYQVFHNCNMPVPNCPHKKTLGSCSKACEEVHDPKTGKTFRVSTFPYYDHDGLLSGSIHIARDITAERERELQLIMSERLASLGQMASGIAHEINNPLASIAGCAEGLLNKVRKGVYDPAFFENYLNIIIEEIGRCKEITKTMLSFVKSSTYENTEIKINDLLDRAVDVIGLQGRMKEIRIVRDYSADSPVYYGNEGEMRQVVLSILTNALDAMNNMGVITIRTGTCPASSVMGCTDDTGSLFIDISDTGPGIKEEDIERIFKPFFTTKTDTGGTGLGLSISQRIIERQNGSISVHTEDGNGARFRITLPMGHVVLQA